MPKSRPPRRFVRLRESATTVERATLSESVTDATVTATGSGRMLIQLISEGIGSSGAYSAAVLEAAARRRVFAKNLPVHANHPTLEEEQSRPERNVLDWVGQLTEDAHYDPNRRALVAEAQIFRPWREVFMDPDFSAAVGLSIRASGLAEHGTYDGKPCLVVTEINEAQSVDFVTRAGRGGKVLALLESARTKLAESPTEQIRTALERVVRAAYGVGERRYAWIRDFDPDRNVVWFDTDGEGVEPGTWEQGYATNGVDVALLGPRRKVAAVTVYRPVGDPESTTVADAVPAPGYVLGEADTNPPTADVTDGAPPAGSTTPINTEEGPAMAETSTTAAGTAPVVDTAQIQFEAREAASARDKAIGDRDTALTEAAAHKARADKAEAELALFRAVEAARPLIAAQLAESGLPAAAQNKVTAAAAARVPLTESRQLDRDGLRTLVEAEITAEKAYVAQLAEASGAGQVTGFGQAPAAQQAAAASSWGAPAIEPNAALIESYLRRGLSAEAARTAALGRAV